jgi:hypothetical protein
LNCAPKTFCHSKTAITPESACSYSLTRLIRQQKANGEIRAAERTRRRFATRYTDTDVGLLAEVDRAHERLNGPSTRRILQRDLT